MKKQKRNNANGITLIALVISIIVMLILAGVSINALVGDNGVLTQTQYASFLNEMSAVEEAVGIWKAGKTIEALASDTTAIPTNGICKAKTLQDAERLIGEVGYYRTWNRVESRPATDILSDPNTFNESFESELVFYPAGVQDLYYLNNEAIGIKGNKTYLIDASTGMIYSMTGIGIKGTRCYSIAMAKAVMNGDTTMPLFAEAEVSGSGDGKAHAGNYTDKYLENGTENPDYDEFGFRVVGDTSNVNVYKLYNNGDLYAKGVKGYLLNSKDTDMNGLDESLYEPVNVPSYIPGVSTNEFQLIVGYDTIYIIDKNKELWAWGKNNNNKLGLSRDEQISYSGYEAKKIAFPNYTVEKVFTSQRDTFVLLKNSSNIYELYASGYNASGQLGTGEVKNEPDSFKKVNFTNPENIINVISGKQESNLILTEENGIKNVYYAGCSAWAIFSGTELYNQNCSNFVNLSDYSNLFLNKNISNICSSYMVGYYMVMDNKLYTFNGTSFVLQSFNDEEYILEDISVGYYVVIVKVKINNESQIWYYSYTNQDNYIGVNSVENVVVNGWTRLDTYFPTGITGNDIKDFYVGCDRIGSARNSITYLTKDGRIFGSGQKWALGVGVTSDSETTSSFEIIDYLPTIESMECEHTNNLTSGTIPLKGSDGKFYMTGNGTLSFNERILQGSWKLIAQNVKKFNAQTSASKNCLAYIDFNNDLWVLGESGITIGLNTMEKNRTFVRLKDYYKDTALYDKIDGNIDDYGIAYSSIYFKTNGDDNNTVYLAGKDYIGYGNVPLYNVPTPIKENVRLMSVGLFSKHFITNDNEWYSMGTSTGISAASEPTINDSCVDSIDVEKITAFFDGTYGHYIIADGKLYGSAGSGGRVSGHNPESSSYKLIEPSVFGNEKIITVAAASQATIAITESGKAYGWGYETYLGVGENDTSVYTPTPQLLRDLESVSSIAPCYGYAGNVTCLFIAIKNDGTVFGTGSNKNGILGRWKGGERNSVSAKYQTAFEWVECPELEI